MAEKPSAGALERARQLMAPGDSAFTTQAVALAFDAHEHELREKLAREIEAEEDNYELDADLNWLDREIRRKAYLRAAAIVRGK